MSRAVLRMAIVSIVLLVALGLGAAGAPPVAAQGDASSAPFAYDAESLDFGLPGPRPDLSTPQAAVEFFQSAAGRRDFARAAHALNLSLVAPEERAERAATLAKRLDYVIDAAVGIDWSGLPDRPDGAIEKPRQSGAPPPRRTIGLGAVDTDGRSVPVNLQRFAPPDGDPLWLFSPHTVAEIDAMYAAEGPGLIARVMPEDLRRWAMAEKAAWSWIVVTLLAGLGTVGGWILSGLLLRVVRRPRDLWVRKATAEIGPPLTAVLALAIFNAVIPWIVSPAGPAVEHVQPAAEILLYIAAVWLAVKIISGLGDAASVHYESSLRDPEDVTARRARTKIGVGRRILVAIAMIVGVGLVLLQIDAFQTVGLSLLASAGAVTLIVSIAARPLLENMAAGIQIAATEPVRIGDVVLFEGHWGTIETIAFTHVVIHTWDLRRVIVPHGYFLSHPFENWTQEDESRTMTVRLRVDHRVDIDALRAKYLEIIETDDRWVGDDKRLEVYDMSDDSLDVRVLACGANSSDAWFLSTRIREELVKFLQTCEGGRYLVRSRTVLERQPGEPLSLAGAEADNGKGPAKERRTRAEAAPRSEAGAAPADSDGASE